MSPAVEHVRPFPLRVSTCTAKSPPDEPFRERPLYVATTTASEDRREREPDGQCQRAQRDLGQ